MTRLRSIVVLIGAALVLMGNLGSCGWQRDGVVVLPAEPPRLDRPDSKSMTECTWPTAVKLSLLTRHQVEDLLRSNAINQIACVGAHHNLIKFIDDRDGGLAGATPSTPAR